LDELVKRAKQGDQHAFSSLVERHKDSVFRLAVSILGREFVPEAEDLTQDVFLKAHRNLSTFRGDSEFGSWLYKITFNLALNVKRRTRYRAPHLGERALEQMAGQEKGPLQQAETSQRDQVLAECIQKLPEAYQSALRLYYWLDVSVAEIGELLGVPENTAKSYLFRARQLLQSMLKERGCSDE